MQMLAGIERFVGTTYPVMKPMALSKPSLLVFVLSYLKICLAWRNPEHTHHHQQRRAHDLEERATEGDSKSCYIFYTNATAPYLIEEWPSVPNTSPQANSTPAPFLSTNPIPRGRCFYFIFKPAINASINPKEVTIWLNGGPGCSSLVGFFSGEWIHTLVWLDAGTSVRYLHLEVPTSLESIVVEQWMQKYLQFPPPGNQPHVSKLEPNTSCNTVSIALEAIYTVNACFNYYHITDVCPFVEDRLLYQRPYIVQQYINRTDVREALHAPPAKDLHD
jgi:hypothetical protein